MAKPKKTTTPPRKIAEQPDWQAAQDDTRAIAELIIAKGWTPPRGYLT